MTRKELLWQAAKTLLCYIGFVLFVISLAWTLIIFGEADAPVRGGIMLPPMGDK